MILSMVAGLMLQTASTPPACAPGANCPQGQTGGVSIGTLNMGAPKRHLSDDAQSNFPDGVNYVALGVGVFISRSQSDDTIPLANEIYSALGKRNWRINGLGSLMQDPAFPGVAILVDENPREAVANAAMSITTYLNNNGIKAQIIRIPGNDPSAVLGIIQRLYGSGYLSGSDICIVVGRHP